MRNVVAVAICLAGMVIFSGCGGKDKDDNDNSIKYRPGIYSSGENYSQSKNENESVTLRGATYTRIGFTQTGWSTKEDGSVKDYNLNGTYSDNANITLFPFWTEGDGGDGGDDDDEGEGVLKFDGNEFPLSKAQWLTFGMLTPVLKFNSPKDVQASAMFEFDFAAEANPPIGSFNPIRYTFLCRGATQVECIIGEINGIPTSCTVTITENAKGYIFEISGTTLSFNYATNKWDDFAHPFSIYYKSSEYKGANFWF